MFCSKCGQALSEGIAVCPNCGNVLPSNITGANSGTRLKSTFSGSNYTPSSAPVDVHKTYCTPVEFESAPTPNPTPVSAPTAPASSYSGGYGYSATASAYNPYHRDTSAGSELLDNEKKGVGGRIARTILVSILLLIVLFGPMYGNRGGLFPEHYYNAFENLENLDNTFENLEYYAEYGDGLLMLSYITYLVAFFMLLVSTVGSFISGLCNGKGAVRAFSVLGIVTLALCLTALGMETAAYDIEFSKVLSIAFDPDTGIYNIGFYLSFIIFIVNCAIASKD